LIKFTKNRFRLKYSTIKNFRKTDLSKLCALFISLKMITIANKPYRKTYI